MRFSEFTIGGLFAIFGLAGGAAVGAILALYPSLAGPLLYGSLAICALCVICGVVIAVRAYRKEGNAEQAPARVVIKNTRYADVSNNKVTGSRQFLHADRIKRLLFKDNDLRD